MIEFPICFAAAAFSIPRTGWQKVLKVLLFAADHCSRGFGGKMNSRMISRRTKMFFPYKLRIPSFRSPRPGWGRPGLTATTPAWTWWTPRSTPSPPPGRNSHPGRGMTRNRYKTNIKSQGFIGGRDEWVVRSVGVWLLSILPGCDWITILPRQLIHGIPRVAAPLVQAVERRIF